MPLTLSGTNGVSGVDGSASTPANRGSDTNTGVVYGTDTVQIATGGTTAVTVDSSQNVGVGTSTINSSFVVAGPSYYSHFNTGNSTPGGTSPWLGLLNNTSIGSATFGWAWYDSNADGSLNLYNWSGTTTSSFVCSYERGSGKYTLGSGTGANVWNFKYSSNAGAAGRITDSNPQNGNTFLQFYNGATLGGQITSNGSTTMTYGSASDYRLKENIATLIGGLNTVLSLRPVTYTWKETGEVGRGFIAHELQAVVPECVSGDKDGTWPDETPRYQMVDQAHLGAHLVSAIQELSAKLDAAEARIAALEAK